MTSFSEEYIFSLDTMQSLKHDSLFEVPQIIHKKEF